MEKNLLCAESCSEDKVAAKDKVILDDERVLDYLLETEIVYMPQKQYFKKSDLDPATRKIVAKWMLEVCEEEDCAEPVLPLAINLLDRFLSKCYVPKKFLQLIAADCLLIASKIRQSLPIAINTLCYYTDHSVTPSQLKNFETLIAMKLKWDLAAVTGFDFIDQILQRVNWCNNRHEKIIRVHSVTLLHFTCTDVKFFDCKPSLVAAACIICATKGIRMRIDSEELLTVCKLIRADVTDVENVASKIERILSEDVSHIDVQQQSITVSKVVENSTRYEPVSKYTDLDKAKKPETPVDVQNVNF